MSEDGRSVAKVRGEPFALRLGGGAHLSHAEAEAAAAWGTLGFLHSWALGSAVDGPGIRLVLWTTGCHMRCQYCHNPDTWHLRNGSPVTVAEVLKEVASHQRFMRAAGGGITISGGEPLVQAPFVTNILRECHERGVHTALDTNGMLGNRLSDEDLDAVDLVLLDIKSWDAETHRRVTGQAVGPVLRFAERLAALNRPAWLRFVLVPGLTDDPANVEGLARFAAGLGNVERVDVLPFHQLGRFKWRDLSLEYPLNNTESPSPELLERVVGQFRSHGLNAW
jgi:pyruvate formate lyase activating enzyme